MGLTGELVRSVFSKNRPVGAHDGNAMTYGVDKRRWSLVRSYFCGDEYNSVLAEDNSASIRSSEATVTQPITEDLNEDGNLLEIQSGEYEDHLTDEKQDSSDQCNEQENAAIVIQSAFRGFLARHGYGEIKQLSKRDNIKGTESPSEESVGTSIEVQTGDSADLRIRELNVIVRHKAQQKARSQISRLKEEWDDNTVSSKISKMRIQNRLEATTRRERALAYAFSQQLRTCTKKKPTRSGSVETNLGWSWLERWMATRQPENSLLVEDCLSKCFEPTSGDRRSMTIKMKFDVSGEEKESCASNDVSVGFDALSITEQTASDGYRPIRNKLRASRSVSRCKTVPTYQFITQPTKVSKKDHLREPEKEKKHKQIQARSAGEIKCKDVSS
ncbi:hypothetical protein AAC387_Pa01g2249 [Persea americana]